MAEGGGMSIRLNPNWIIAAIAFLTIMAAIIGSEVRDQVELKHVRQDVQMVYEETKVIDEIVRDIQVQVAHLEGSRAATQGAIGRPPHVAEQ